MLKTIKAQPLQSPESAGSNGKESGSYDGGLGSAGEARGWPGEVTVTAAAAIVSRAYRGSRTVDCEHRALRGLLGARDEGGIPVHARTLAGRLGSHDGVSTYELGNQR